jgi:ankyrin repeat protein
MKQSLIITTAISSLLLSSCVMQQQMQTPDAAALAQLKNQGLIQNAAQVNEMRLPSGATLLIDAAEKGNAALVDTLLAAGADPNGQGYSINAVPLTRTQSAAVVSSLIKAGADVNVVDASGTTPLSRALSTANAAGVEALLQAGASLTPDVPADPPLLVVRDVPTAERLIAAGACVNCSSSRGVTPLMRAVSRNDEDLVRYYIEQGADVTAADAAGNTALHAARSATVVKMLCEAGAHAQALNLRGETALFDILHTPATVQALVDAGVPLNVISTETGLTALLSKLSDNREDDDSILALIRAGADVQLRTPKGETALSLAQQRKSKRRVAIIRAIIQRTSEDTF